MLEQMAKLYDMTRALIALVFVTTALLALGACTEQRVVHESYSPMTGLTTGASYRYSASVSAVSAPPKRQQNFFEKAVDNVDQFLFGWAKSKKPTTQTAVPAGQSYDPIWLRGGH